MIHLLSASSVISRPEGWPNARSTAHADPFVGIVKTRAIVKGCPPLSALFPCIRTGLHGLDAISAEGTRKVTTCCASKTLLTTLPVLFVELEKCQKSLEDYLEQKRSKFPRFYFLSNPVLLLVLSQGSNPVQMQPHYEHVFDSISHVVHDIK